MEKELFFGVIGKNISQKRKEKGITIEELSNMTGLREGYLKKIEAGRAYGLTATKFLVIAEALGTAPNELVEGCD